VTSAETRTTGVTVAFAGTSRADAAVGESDRSGLGVQWARLLRVKVVDWLFRDRRTGRTVIAQWPNVALGIWLVATVVEALADPGGRPGSALRLVGRLALAWWAGDEILRGVNPWRRMLGAIVLAGLVASLVR